MKKCARELFPKETKPQSKQHKVHRAAINNGKPFVLFSSHYKLRHYERLGFKGSYDDWSNLQNSCSDWMKLQGCAEFTRID